MYKLINWHKNEASYSEFFNQHASMIRFIGEVEPTYEQYVNKAQQLGINKVNQETYNRFNGL